MLLRENVERSVQLRLVDAEQVVRDLFQVEVLRVDDELQQDAVRRRPPEPHEALSREEFFEEVPEGLVHNLPEARVDDQEPVEPLHEDEPVRGYRRPGLPVLRDLIHEPLDARPVQRPLLREGFRNLVGAAVSEALVDVPPQSARPRRERVMDRQHVAIPARGRGKRVRYRVDV